MIYKKTLAVYILYYNVLDTNISNDFDEKKNVICYLIEKC